MRLWSGLSKIALMLGILGVGWWLAYTPAGGQTLFRTEVISPGDIDEVITAVGTLNPEQIVTVGTQVSGKIDKLYVNVNDTVQEGQLLAQVDPTVVEAQLKQSQSSLETARDVMDQAERDLKRTRELVKRGYVAQVELEKAEQTFRSARNSFNSASSQVETAQANLNYTRILSPINGVVISRDVKEGETVAASFQTPNLFKIAGDLARMTIEVNLSESDIGKVKIGLPVKFTVDAYPDREFKGEVKTISLNSTNQQGVVTYAVTVLVTNTERALFPGMTAYVTVTLSEHKGVLRMPTSALRFTPPPERQNALQRLFSSSNIGYGGMRSYRVATSASPQAPKTANIYLLKNGHPEKEEVTLGVTDDTFIEISGDGVHEGDEVVTGVQVMP